MELEQLQKAYKAGLAELDQLEKGVTDANLTEETLVAYEQKLGECKRLARAIDTMDAHAALRQDAEKSTGSIVSDYSRRVLPDEGNIPGVTADPRSGEMHAWKAIGEEKLKAIKSGAYLDGLDQYIRNKAMFGDDWKSHMKADHMKVLNEGQDTAGGLWIPPDFRSNVIQKAAAMTAIRPNATVVTTGRDIVTFPAATYTTDDKYTSGVRFAWMGSAAQSSAVAESTNPVSGVARIQVNLAVAKILIQREQAEDNAFDLLGFVTGKMTEAFALGGEDAYIGGDGNAKPRGLKNHPTFGIADGSTSVVNSVTYSGGYIKTGLAAALSWQGSSNDEPTLGILGMVGAVPPQYDAAAKWYGNKKSYVSVMGLTDSNKRPFWFANEGGYPSIVRGFPSTLQGYPIERSQFFDDVGADALPLFLGDMGAYYIVDRVALSVEVFRETYADRDQILVYARMRTGGDLLDYWRMKALKCAA